MKLQKDGSWYPLLHYDYCDEVFSDSQSAIDYIESCGKFPVVIKADGLALGKGVIIAQTREDAKKAVKEMMEDKVFGESGSNIVIEEFLTGPEVSVLSFTDGKTVVPMVSSMDHKRAKDNDEGLNTGGMGTISPNPFYDEAMAKEYSDNPKLAELVAELKGLGA